MDMITETVKIDRMNMLISYINAINDAGGDSKSFVSDIGTMTVREMIDRLAQNGVRFVYEKPQRLSVPTPVGDKI